MTVSAPGREPLAVSESEEMRAFGFSPDGTTFILATAPGLAIYRRGDERQCSGPTAKARHRELRATPA